MGLFLFYRFGVGVPGRYLFYEHTVFITETAAENNNHIDEPADAEHAAGEQPNQASTNLANIKSMYTKIAQEQAKEERYPFVLGDMVVGWNVIDNSNVWLLSLLWLSGTDTAS